MAKLIYSAIASADGYVEDAAGSFDCAARHWLDRLRDDRRRSRAAELIEPDGDRVRRLFGRGEGL
jgi:hypothetical protein